MIAVKKLKNEKFDAIYDINGREVGDIAIYSMGKRAIHFIYMRNHY
jgi:hypothetical protein